MDPEHERPEAPGAASFPGSSRRRRAPGSRAELDLAPVVRRGDRVDTARRAAWRRSPRGRDARAAVKQRLAVVELRGDEHARPPGGRAPRASTGAPSAEPDQGLTVELEDVEGDVDQAPFTPLEEREARRALLVERAHLAVEHHVRRADRRGGSVAGERARTVRQLLAVPAEEASPRRRGPSRSSGNRPTSARTPSLAPRGAVAAPSPASGRSQFAPAAPPSFRRSSQFSGLPSRPAGTSVHVPLSVRPCSAKSARRHASPRRARRSRVSKISTVPAPYWPAGSRPRRSRTRADDPRRAPPGAALPARVGTPFGTAQLASAPSRSSRRS